MLVFYNYSNSSASYRVRIVLNLKNIKHQKMELDLKTNMQLQDDYLKQNPQGLVPMIEDGHMKLTQSMAIMEYFEEKYANPPILPAHLEHRAWVRAFANVVCCDTHPLNNLRVLKYLGILDVKEDRVLRWYHHWLRNCFDTLEFMLENTPKKGFCCTGDDITLADICLVPQMYNGRRYKFDFTPYPLCVEKEKYLLGQKPFIKAAPEAMH